MRVLGAIRQSRAKEASESPDSQRQDITRWAGREGHTFIGEAADIGVSATVPPYERLQLGPWLSDPELLAQWDILAVWKIDRVVRDMTHFYGDLMPELQRLGKHVVAVTESVNTLTTSATELGFRIGMAQDELSKIRDRAQRSRKALRENARWGGGIPPFGYYSEKTSDGYRLAIDEEAMRALHSVIDLLKVGYPVHYCLQWLTQEQILTAWDRHAERMGREPRGRLWRWRTLETMLQSRHLLGQGTYKGQVIRDEEGTPKQFGEPLISREQYDELQSLLNRPKRKYHRSNSSMLRHVAYCAYCGCAMYHRPPTSKDFRRYYCSSRHTPKERECYESAYPADQLERLVAELFLDTYGHREIVEKEATPVVDHSARLTEIDEALDQLETDRYVKGQFRGEKGEKRFDQIYAQLEAEREELSKVSSENQGIKWIHTGKTYADAWEEASPSERGGLLRYWGVTIMVQWPRSDWGIPLVLSHYVRVDFPYLDAEQ